MTRVIRFCGTCLLLVSLAAVALADGGETQGPGLAPPQPPTTECTDDRTGNEAFCPVPELSVDASDVTNLLVTWLLQSAR